MRKNIEISNKKINEFLEQFYGYFESGYAFEEFLKVYLEKIGFVFTPVFSKNAMDALKDESDDLVKEDGTVEEENESVKLIVDKQISANDIRARILRLPKAVSNLLPDDANKVKVIFNGMAPKELTIAKNRSYLSGVTDLYKESGLIAEDGSYNPCKAIWKFSEEKIDIIIKEY